MADFHDDITRAIGQVVVEWGKLDRELRYIACEIAAPDMNTAAVMIIQQIKMRDLIKGIKAAVFSITRGKIPFPAIDATLNTINSDIRTERNRIVHDHWILPDTGAAYRYNANKTGNINSEKGSGNKFLTIVCAQQVSIEKVIALSAKIEQSRSDLRRHINNLLAQQSDKLNKRYEIR